MVLGLILILGRQILGQWKVITKQTRNCTLLLIFLLTRFTPWEQTQRLAPQLVPIFRGILWTCLLQEPQHNLMNLPHPRLRGSSLAGVLIRLIDRKSTRL